MALALAAANGAFKPCTIIDLSMGYVRPISQADALLAAKLMRLGKALTFCSCAVSAAGTDKPAALAAPMRYWGEPGSAGRGRYR